MENDSYYIKYHNNNGNESASFCYYYDVHKDGFSFKDYTIYDNDISYEHGGWSGKSPYSFDCGMQITARKFHRWADEIERTKKTIIVRRYLFPMSGKCPCFNGSRMPEPLFTQIVINIETRPVAM